jgi:hypothetical protein
MHLPIISSLVVMSHVNLHKEVLVSIEDGDDLSGLTKGLLAVFDREAGGAWELATFLTKKKRRS